MNQPRTITFTGVDESTSLDQLLELTSFYPEVEFGVLFSPKKQGAGRYPRLDFIHRLLALRDDVDMRFAAHLCGAHARALIAGQELPHEVDQLLHGGYFQRVQINTADPSVNPVRLANWGEQRGMSVILQCRDPERFPDQPVVSWLYDVSGGNGRSPDAWPRGVHDNVTYAYAGGIGPGNIKEVIAAVSTKAARYSLDMESGVRDEQDRFSIDACYKVCHAAWGPMV